MDMNRRDFLRTSTTLGAVASLGITLPLIAHAAIRARDNVPNISTRHVKSTCAHCVNFCGINIKLENNVICAIYPDPARAPYYNVGICPKGVSGLFNPYDPYRIKTPLKRTNPKKDLGEDPRWVAISWDLDHATTDAMERGMKMVVIEPRLSHTAAKADEWLPIRPGKDVLLLLGMAKQLIDADMIDRPFLTGYTNAPCLVGADGHFLRNAEGTPLVWDRNSQSARPFSVGVQPELQTRQTIEGATYRTAFQIFADSIKGITPDYVEKNAGIPADKVTSLAQELGKQARIGATVVVDGQRLRYRPVAIHTFRGLAAKQFGMQSWRAGLILQMLLGNIDAVGGINLHSVYKKTALSATCQSRVSPDAD